MSDTPPKDRTVPGADWSVDAVLNGVSWEAEYLFRRIVDRVNQDWRIQVPPDSMDSCVRGLCLSTERRLRAWPVSKVASALRELMAAGIVLRLEHGGRCWLEIAERLQYRKGQNHAANASPVAAQGELGLPPTLFGLPPASPPPVPHYSLPVKTGDCSKKRVEEKRSNDSGAVRPLASASPRESEESAARQTGRFARDESANPTDEAWSDFIHALGLVEMHSNGALWVQRWKHKRSALIEAMQDWKSKTPQQRAEGGGNAAAYFTQAYERARRAA